MNQLKRPLPYYTPYRGELITGLTLVVVSTAITAVIPWILRLAIDGLRAGEPLDRIGRLSGSIVAVAVLAQAPQSCIS